MSKNSSDFNATSLINEYFESDVRFSWVLTSTLENAYKAHMTKEHKQPEQNLKVLEMLKMLKKAMNSLNNKNTELLFSYIKEIDLFLKNHVYQFWLTSIYAVST